MSCQAARLAGAYGMGIAVAGMDGFGKDEVTRGNISLSSPEGKSIPSPWVELYLDDGLILYSAAYSNGFVGLVGENCGIAGVGG